MTCAAALQFASQGFSRAIEEISVGHWVPWTVARFPERFNKFKLASLLSYST